MIDAAAYSVMVGCGETYLPAFALALGLGPIVAGMVASVPLLVGASRKRFIGGLGQGKEPKSREPGSHGAAIASAAQGAQMFRVHDVAGSRQALAVWRASMFGTEN